MKSKNLFILLILVINSSSLLLAHTESESFGHHGMMHGISGMGFFGWLSSLLFLSLLVLLIAWLIKQIQEPQRRPKRK